MLLNESISLAIIKEKILWFNFKHTVMYLCFVSIIPLSVTVFAADWQYSGNKGPDHWANLSNNYQLCRSGKNQSPVNLSNILTTTLKPLVFDYLQAGTTILHTGHSLKLSFDKQNALTLDDKPYSLKYLYFHAPSEHQVEGKHFPMEAHFVHTDKTGQTVILALFIEQGKTNEILNKAWTMLPKKKNDSRDLSPGIVPAELLPTTYDYFRYNGSLTTPPCSEGVTWLILKTAITASKLQIEQFIDITGPATNRPIQKINARAILQ